MTGRGKQTDLHRLWPLASAIRADAGQGSGVFSERKVLA